MSASVPAAGSTHTSWRERLSWEAPRARARAPLTPKNVPLLLGIALLALSACHGPRTNRAPLATQPGWGRGFTPAERELSVRAVPASAAPSVPATRLGRPGWGSPLPVK